MVTQVVGEAAKKLRRRATVAERMLWEQLRGRRLCGHRFRRQHQIGAFVLDFYCPKLRLAVEVDGDVHESDEQRRRDESRSTALTSLGIQVLRFTNDDVALRLPAVLRTIALAAEQTANDYNRAPTPNAPPPTRTPATDT